MTLFVLFATAGNRFLKAVAQRHNSMTGQGRHPGVQLLGDVAVVCVVPVTSVFRAQILAQSTPASQTPTSCDIAKEACLCLMLVLVTVFFLKRVLPRWAQVALLAVQPTKGACSADDSPEKGLNTCSLECLLESFHKMRTRPWQIGRRCVQRRRLYIHDAVNRLEGMLPSLPVPFGHPSPSTLASRLPRASTPGSHGVHDWHEASPAGFLMPVEVAACRSSPEVVGTISRLLADRWDELRGRPEPLESVPEDQCLQGDEPVPEDADLVY